MADILWYDEKFSNKGIRFFSHPITKLQENGHSLYQSMVFDSLYESLMSSPNIFQNICLLIIGGTSKTKELSKPNQRICEFHYQRKKSGRGLYSLDFLRYFKQKFPETPAVWYASLKLEKLPENIKLLIEKHSIDDLLDAKFCAPSVKEIQEKNTEDFTKWCLNYLKSK